MTDEQIRDWRLEQARKVAKDAPCQLDEYAAFAAVAIEYARLVAGNAMPAEDEYSAFQSEIEPDRWYVGKGRVAIFATEIGASGEREAREVAALFNGDKRTAALQAELDRANGSVNAVREVCAFYRMQPKAEGDAVLASIETSLAAPFPDKPQLGLSKEWCMKMAALEGDHSIGAGSPDHPLRTGKLFETSGYAPSPNTPQPAVVITDEHRQAYRRLRDHMGYPGAANDRKFIDALFAEPSS